MKIITYLCAMGALVLFLGCNRNSESSAGSAADHQSISSGSERSSSASTTPDSGMARPAAETAANPDNTGKNVRDRSGDTMTSVDQGENQSDLDITRRIRRAITSNDQLSTDAKNIKIVTANGKVTLRGPVKNDEERKTIATIAQQTAGGSVDDQLEVKSLNQP